MHGHPSCSFSMCLRRLGWSVSHNWHHRLWLHSHGDINIELMPLFAILSAWIILTHIVLYEYTFTVILQCIPFWFFEFSEHRLWIYLCNHVMVHPSTRDRFLCICLQILHWSGFSAATFNSPRPSSTAISCTTNLVHRKCNTFFWYMFPYNSSNLKNYT